MICLFHAKNVVDWTLPHWRIKWMGCWMFLLLELELFLKHQHPKVTHPIYEWQQSTSVIFVWNQCWWLIESIKIWYYTFVAQLIKQTPLLTDSPRIILNKEICNPSNICIHWIVLERFSPILHIHWFGYWSNVHTIAWQLYSTINKIPSGWTDCSL